jgi:hypothetical protein
LPIVESRAQFHRSAKAKVFRFHGPSLLPLSERKSKSGRQARSEPPGSPSRSPCAFASIHPRSNGSTAALVIRGWSKRRPRACAPCALSWSPDSACCGSRG